MISQLDDHLNISVWGALEFLDQPFAIPLISQNSQVMQTNNVPEIPLGFVDRLVNFLIDNKVDWPGLRQITPDTPRSKVELILEDHFVNIIIQPVGRCAIHHRVLAHEPSSAVLTEDELERFIKETVLAVAVPVLVSTVFKCYRGGVVEADHE